MKALASLTSVLAFVACASAAQQSYFFHHSATPVAVPGGTSSFFLDDTAPAAAAPTLEGGPSHRHTTLTFPTFIGRPFASDATLMDPCVTVGVFLSAGAELDGCVDLMARIDRVDSGGARGQLACESVTGVRVPRGLQGGAVGSRPFTLALPIGSGTVIHAGESVAVTVFFVNNCDQDRPVHLAYDAEVTPAQLGFGACGLAFGGDDEGCLPDSRDHLKCAETLGKAFTKAISAVIKCHQKQADGRFKGDDATSAGDDEEGCESSNPRSAKAKLDEAIGKASSCSSTQLTVAAAYEAVLFGPQTNSSSLDARNSDVYCDSASGSPIGDDDAGFVASNRDQLKCADSVGKGLAKLIATAIKCHTKKAHEIFAGKPFAEETCEETDPVSGKGALDTFDALRDKLVAIGICPACLDGAHLDALAADALTRIDAENALLFPCEANATAATCP